jgi:hypothetical protein
VAHGATPAFGRGALDARTYLSPAPGHVLALGARADAATGATPFTLLPGIGGSKLLRGYIDGRWRDRATLVGRAEWRFPIAGRFRGVVFGGAGAVGPSFAALGPARAAGGAGLRFRLTESGANLRGDVAYGADGVQVYFLTLEAF